MAGVFVLAGPVTAASATAAVPGTQPAWATASAARGATASGEQVKSTVFLAGQNESGMVAYAQAVSDPSNSAYHAYLTPAQYQARFGATAEQVSAVESWLRGAGLTITATDAETISVSGTVAQSQAAFGTTFENYQVGGSVYYAPNSNAQIPASVASDVLTISGMTNMPIVAKPSSLVGEESTSLVAGVTGVKATESTGSDGAPFLGPTPCSEYYGQKVDSSDPALNGSSSNPYVICGYVPSQLRGAYGVTQSGLTGRGATVAIVDAYGSSTILSDANTYATNHGDNAFKSGQFAETVTPADWTNEAACGGPAGWAPEETLDVEAVHAMAPNAGVRYYGANSCEDSDLLASFDQILNARSADIVSDSWGEVIYSSTGNEPTATIAEYTHDFEQGAVEGISFQFSAGDCGAEDPATSCGTTDTSTTPQADFPTSDQWATSVGGTSLAIGRNNQQLWNTDWGTDALALESGSWASLGWIYGGGGGTSAVFSEPFYQRGAVPTSLAETLPDGTRVSSPMRVAPDVSMDADPFTGFLIGETQALPDGSTGYGESDIGGTSLACPLFAGLQADAIQAQGGRPIGFANPAIYAKYGSPAFTDVADSGPGVHAANILPAFEGDPDIAVTFGDDRLLKATRGYDDATGVGTASRDYLLLSYLW
ncbi:MAG TPA: S53 family peptidase [Actinocrinis sp.]|jgi:subtilase family serine protease